MITVQPSILDLARRAVSVSAAIELESARSGSLPSDMPAKLSAPFQPLDPEIVSETIPAFFIGRNKEGFWVARDAKGRIGGLFLLEASALSFAKKNSRPAGCATVYPSERFELDLANNGNPLVVLLRPWMRLAIGLRLRMAGLIDRMTKAAKRRLGDFRLL